MGNNVIILGAGFSYCAGIPLLSGFVDKILEYKIRGKANGQPLSSEEIKIFNDAINVRNKLAHYHRTAYIDDRNIEDILSILSFNVIGNDKNARNDFNKMVRAITKTIELSCQIKEAETNIYTPVDEFNILYIEFWRNIFKFFDRNRVFPTILTFNYDLVLERSLFQAITTRNDADVKIPFKSFKVKYYYELMQEAMFKIQRDQRLFDRSSRENINGTSLVEVKEANFEADTEIELLKLHGSLNFSTRFKRYSMSNICHAFEDPFIMPPIFNKSTSQKMEKIWSIALRKLKEAHNIIIVGYSLPKTDIYMQYFLKAGIGQNTELNKIFVFDPVLYKGNSEGEAMKRRFSECFSPQIQNRICFNPNEKDWGRIVSDEKLGTASHFVGSISGQINNTLFY